MPPPWRKEIPGLTFDPVAHEYRVDGAKVRSVTETLDLAGLYPPMTPAAEAAMVRGKAVHLATQLWDEGVLDPASVDPRIAGYFAAYRKFKAESAVDILLIEQPVCSRSQKYAGTIDRVVAFPNSTVGVLDIKTGASVDPVTVAQLAGYKKALAETLACFAWRRPTTSEDGKSLPVRTFEEAIGSFFWRDDQQSWSLLLRADGTYSLKRHEDGRDLWMAALVIAKFKEEHRGRNC